MARYETVVARPGAAGIQELVRVAVALLESGGVLAHPTDGVYGVGGAMRPEVDRCLADLKARVPDRSPLIRIGSDTAVLHRSFPDLLWPPPALRLASRFWPGPLTLVLDDGSSEGLALRAEGHPVTRAILEAWNRPIGSTSLNITGESPAATAGKAATILEKMPDVEASVLLVDAGDLAGPPPSTLVSLVGGVPAVLREGAVSREAIEDCLGLEGGL